MQQKRTGWGIRKAEPLISAHAAGVTVFTKACSADKLSRFHHWLSQQPTQPLWTPCKFHPFLPHRYLGHWCQLPESPQPLLPTLPLRSPGTTPSNRPRPLGYPRVRSWPPEYLPIPERIQQSLLRPLWPCKCKMLASTLEVDHLSCAVLGVSPSSCASESHQPNTHCQSPLQCTCSAGKCS